MKLIPVALVLFYRMFPDKLQVWTQVREDDGIYHGLLEFPGGGIEAGEEAIDAAVREVEEEVGIKIDKTAGKLMGIYPNHHTNRTILLNVFLFPDQLSLSNKGQWLDIEKEKLSSPYLGKIPGPNHLIIDDLFRALYSEAL